MRGLTLTLVATLLATMVAPALAAPLPPGGTFADDNGSVFEADIEAIAAEGITKGCNPPTNNQYCPHATVTRGQMAAFLTRALDLTPTTTTNTFTDDNGSVFEADIEAIATQGITKGCNPPTNNQYCPDATVTRGQMAAFLTRALSLEPIVVPLGGGSVGCDGTDPIAGEHQITIGSETRTYLIDLPPTYDDRTPTPLLLGFHGAGGSAASFRNYGHLGDAAGTEAILVHPDAGSSRAWNSSADLDFFDAIVEKVLASACVDVAHIFATGHSSGGFMSNRIGCERGDIVSAIGPVAGGGPYPRTCDGPVASIVIHGDPDPVVAFSIGVASRDRWLEINGCTTATSSVGAGGVEYTRCSSGEPVQWWVHDQGHSWPSFAAGAVWDFFSSQ